MCNFLKMTDVEYNEMLLNKWCTCGSKQHKYALYDARNIFCCYVCQKCEQTKRNEYRTDIFIDTNYWHDEPIEND